MKGDAFQVVRDFEAAVAKYTGAPYCVAVNSCTMALLLAFARLKTLHITNLHMPRQTYPSVPMSAYHLGLSITWNNINWQEKIPRVYMIDHGWAKVHFVWDCAKRFTSGMYVTSQIQCVSFHAAKLLKIGQGGAILHDDPLADEWYRRARFDGRKEGILTKDDEYHFPGWHCYMSPDAAARGLWLLQSYPEHVPDQEPHEYPDMSKWEW